MTLARELADTAGRPQVDKNLLINGGMNVWQRSTSETGITSGGYKTVDRWDLDIVNSFGTGAGTYTMARSTDVPSAQGFAYSTKIDCTTVGDQVGGSPINLNLVKLDQYIEGQNVQHLLKGTSSAKALTLSFWVKSNRASTFVVQFTDPTNSRNISKSYTINTANTWEKKTILIPGDVTGTIDNDNTRGFTVEFWLFAGLGYLTGGSLATSWGANAENTWAVGAQSLTSTSDEWLITGVQLEVGESATDFQFEPYETVFRKCFRYTQKIEGDPPSGSSSSRGIFFGVPYFSSTIYSVHHFVVPMRTTPSITLSTSVGSLGTWLVGGGNDRNPSSFYIGSANAVRVELISGLSGNTTEGNASWFRTSAGEFVIFDAEL